MTESRSYHGQPILKRPTWTWEIPYYLFTGGLGGASAGLAYACELGGCDVLARRAWLNALIGITASPPLLISDLGRPARFLNMLRMFKVTSPMSVGSWILVVSGGATTLAAAETWLPLPPWLARVGRIAKPAAALFGMPLSAYTAALLSATSVPVWHEARRGLPFVFVSGAAVSAAGAALVTTPPAHAAPARRLALAATVVELGATELMERRLGGHGEVYRSGRPRRFRDAARVTLAGGAALLTARGARSRRAAVAGGTLLLAGALCTRWSIYEAGFPSADDPRYVVEPQRERVDRGEGRGASRSATDASPEASLGTPALPTRSPLREG